MSVPHKLSLFYYLVLDFDTSNEQKAISEGFTAASGIPNRYQIFMQGLWYMDQLDFSVSLASSAHVRASRLRHGQTALEYIAHPSLIPDFADDIIVALVRHAGNGDPSLAISYYHTVQPSLKSSVALGLLFGAIARTNATEALFFSRAYPEHTRQLLFQQFIRIMVGSAETSDPAVGAADLAFLPFDSTEEEWFQNFLTTGEGKSLRKGKETLLARNVARDQLYGVGRQKVTGQWAPIVKGIRTGLEGLAE